MVRTTVADVVVDGLRRAGVARLFVAEPGPLGAALASAGGPGPLASVAAETPDEAAVMAAVTAELSDVPGAVVVERGDAPALGYAVRARVPVIVLAQAAAPVTAAGLKAVVVAEPASAAHWIAHAIQLALKHPRGPVQLVIPRGLEAQATLPVATAVRPVSPSPDPRLLADAARAIADAARPVLVAGTESRWPGAAPWIRPFAEALPAPVVTTVKGKGTLPDPHPLAFGLLGSVGARTLLERADLVVTLGLDPIETPPVAWPATTAVLPIGAGGAAEAGTVGDVGLVLEELAPRLRSGCQADWDVAELDRLKRLAAAARGRRFDHARIVSIARELVPPGTIVTVDVDADGLAMVEAWESVAPNELFADSKTGGFALAAAVAAALYRPDQRVLCFTAGRPLRAVADRLPPSVIVVTLDTAASAPPAVDGEPALRAALEAALAARQAAVIAARSEPR